MKEIRDNIWKYASKNTAICVLTNDSVTVGGFNPMNGGIALEAKTRNPGIEKIVANKIFNDKFKIGIDALTGAELLRFTTKQQLWTPSTLNIIEKSLIKLMDYINNNLNKTILLPRPGCGFGGLDWDTEVKPLVEKYLGDYKNVYIFSI